jgi:hypothetical protein
MTQQILNETKDLRAQWALDEARRSGGNCVRLAARSALSAGYGGGYSA